MPQRIKMHDEKQQPPPQPSPGLPGEGEKPDLPPLSPIAPGRYRHYKGNDYEVIAIARHSETLEELVLYRALYGDHGLWVRPRAMFLQTIEFQGRQIPRFQFIGNNHRTGHER